MPPDAKSQAMAPAEYGWAKRLLPADEGPRPVPALRGLAGAELVEHHRRARRRRRAPVVGDAGVGGDTRAGQRHHPATAQQLGDLLDLPGVGLQRVLAVHATSLRAPGTVPQTRSDGRLPSGHGRQRVPGPVAGSPRHGAAGRDRRAVARSTPAPRYSRRRPPKHSPASSTSIRRRWRTERTRSRRRRRGSIRPTSMTIPTR